MELYVDARALKAEVLVCEVSRAMACEISQGLSALDEDV